MARFYQLIDWDAVGDPRIVCGYSDITALHLALAKHAGWVTFYGPNFLRFTRRKDDYPLTPETEEWFHRAFKPEPLGRVFEDPREPVRADDRRRRGRGAACGWLPDAPRVEHRDAVRVRGRRAAS